MDRKIFDKHRADCKAGWKQLAISGDKDKPPILLKYEYGCPACALAIKHTLEVTGSSSLNCRMCPVDRWRKAARSSAYSCNGGNFYGVTGCESLDLGGPWDLWRTSNPWSAIRKHAAGRVAELRWTYLQAYNHKEDE